MKNNILEDFAARRIFVEDEPQQIPSSGLTWSGASDVQIDFMKRVYETQVRNAARVRTFVGDVPVSELEEVEGGRKLRRPAGVSCRDLLAFARAELARQQANGVEKALTVSSISVVSGYRSASEQFRNWQRGFPRYYEETREHRSTLSGGAHGPAAVEHLATYIGARLAAPGYSLHNNGLAVDFGTTEAGQALGASTGTSSLAAWRRSWLWDWLTSNAATYQFFQNTRINEPWHWEYRAPAPPREAIIVTAGREELSDVPLLRTHRGTQPDLILKWNDMEVTPDLVDVVIHLHGYSSNRDRMSLVRDKEPFSGLDFFDPDHPYVTVGRQRPTLCILPRGHYSGGEKYQFPALITPVGMQDLIDFSLSHLGSRIGATRLRRGRLIITTHSGGGEALMQVLQHIDPDEVYVFDALYWPVSNLIQWMQRHIRRDFAALESNSGLEPGTFMVNQGSALRVFYRPNTGTQNNSLTVHRAIQKEIFSVPRAGIIVSPWYRVEKTVVGHGQIPRYFGWRLLAAANSDIPEASPP